MLPRASLYVLYLTLLYIFDGCFYKFQMGFQSPTLIRNIFVFTNVSVFIA